MDEESIGILIAAGAFSIFLAIFSGWYLGIIHVRDEATQTECARYHPDTGKFEWLGED